MKYCVTIVRTGCIFVEAETAEEAMDIADHQKTDTVNWSDDWEATDATQDDDISDFECVCEKAFE
jgi:hypothetical protein